MFLLKVFFKLAQFARTQYCRAEFFGHTGLDGNERKGKVKMPCLFYL